MPLLNACQVLLVTIFVISAASKALGRKAFEDTLSQLGFRTHRKLLGYGVIVLEMLGAVFIAIDSTVYLGALMILILTGGFFWSFYRAYVTKKTVKCNCFGSLTTEVFGWQVYLRAFVVGCMALLMLTVRPKSLLLVPFHQTLSVVFVGAGYLAVSALVSIIQSNLFARRHS